MSETRDFISLTKPRIIELLLITTIPAMFAAQREVPPLTLVLATLVGGALAAGSANALHKRQASRHQPPNPFNQREAM